MFVCVTERQKGGGRKTIIHLFFFVEALSVTVGNAEASRVEHIVDFKTAQDALHLPPTWSLAMWQTHPKNTRYILILTQSQT